MVVKDVFKMREYKKPIFTQKHFEILAELLGDSKNIDEFQDKLIARLLNDNSKFSPARFNKAVLKRHQYGGIGCGAPELAEEAQEQDGQPDEAQEWRDFEKAFERMIEERERECKDRKQK
jgi:hypothetical protein